MRVPNRADAESTGISQEKLDGQPPHRYKRVHFSSATLNRMNHDRIATRVEHLSMATGILAGLSAAGAVLAEPTGLDAFGVWLGIPMNL